ncbi:MAG: DUF29 domain-containing protein [Microcystaceae cyanobacterium]
MLAQSVKQLKILYDEDFVLWLDRTTEQIRQENWQDLDWQHLLEELESLGNEQRRKVESYLLRLLIHLLLYQYWLTEREWCGKGWEREIDNFRLELESLFESKTLYNYGLEKLEGIYQKARQKAIQKSQLSSETFPTTCPFSQEQLLDFGFLPD